MTSDLDIYRTANVLVKHYGKGGRKPKMTAKQIKLAKIMLDDPTIVHQEVADGL